MTAHKCPISKRDLDAFIKHLTVLRDDRQKSFDAFGYDVDRGHVDAYRNMFAALHIFTDGKYGQYYDEQPGGAS